MTIRLRRRALRTAFGVLCFTAAATLAAPAGAQSTTGAIPAACDGPGQHDWDFWIGEWSLTGPDGKARGTARIARAVTGCGFVEEISAGASPTGFSFNAFDSTRGQWTQLWASPGTIVRLDGKSDAAGRFIAEGTIAYTAKTIERPLRVEWARVGDGRVRQDFFEREGPGSAWHPTFSQFYVPRHAATKDQ